jgi:hypothetical protein
MRYVRLIQVENEVTHSRRHGGLERFQRVQSHHPRRDRSSEILPVKRSKREHLVALMIPERSFSQVKVVQTVESTQGSPALLIISHRTHLALQSFMMTNPKMFSIASPVPRLLPISLPFPPTIAAISNSMSNARVGPKLGAVLSDPGAGPRRPLGRVMGVPDTTIEEARPWYPTGRCVQAGGTGGPLTAMSRPALVV